MLALVKSLHTLVFLFVSACILYIFYAALVPVYDGKLLFALFIVSAEVVVWWFSGRRCPLTSLARRYGDSSGNDWIADIFLPRWAAEKTPLVCGGLFALSLLILLFNLLQG